MAAAIRMAISGSGIAAMLRLILSYELNKRRGFGIKKNHAPVILQSNNLDLDYTKFG
jgi:hypothetical protein